MSDERLKRWLVDGLKRKVRAYAEHCMEQMVWYSYQAAFADDAETMELHSKAAAKYGAAAVVIGELLRGMR